VEHDESATAAEHEFVEQVALTLERMGVVRMIGRVVGWLLICEPPGQTFNQIAEALQASKGSISNALKFLTTARWVERYSVPGERRDYFRIRPGYWSQIGREQAAQYDDMANLAKQGLDLLAGAPADRRARLREMYELFAWIAREMPALWERYEQEREAGDG
jgi:DNA-binding transcriptional regulator GbsR (MarR family)